ncbi:MAG: hypothetical protein NTZ93_05145 [Candidatus Beckwithbacteria bacterium]|nr:hypothetical protein [Candidatus Beckwithbacteria bacterium]
MRQIKLTSQLKIQLLLITVIGLFLIDLGLNIMMFQKLAERIDWLTIAAFKNQQTTTNISGPTTVSHEDLQFQLDDILNKIEDVDLRLPE